MKFLDLVSKYIIIPAGVLYFAGWIYLYTLCRYVALDVTMLGLDTNSIIMNSYNVLEFVFRAATHLIGSFLFWLATLALVSLGILAYVLGSSAKTTGVVQKTYCDVARSPAAAALVYVLLLFGVAFSSRAAARDYLLHVPSRPGARMLFDFKKEFVEQSEWDCKANPDCYYVYLRAANDSARLRMLMVTPDYFVVWAQHSGLHERSIGEVYLIQKGSVNLAGALDVETCQLGEVTQCEATR